MLYLMEHAKIRETGNFNSEDDRSEKVDFPFHYRLKFSVESKHNSLIYYNYVNGRKVWHVHFEKNKYISPFFSSISFFLVRFVDRAIILTDDFPSTRVIESRSSSSSSFL